AGEVGGAAAVERLPFARGDEHRHARAVAAGIEDLAGLVLVRIERQGRPAEDAVLAGLGVPAVDDAGDGEAGEAEERLAVVPPAEETAHRTEARQLELAERRAVAAEEADLRVGVLQIVGD